MLKTKLFTKLFTVIACFCRLAALAETEAKRNPEYCSALVYKKRLILAPK